MPISVKELKHFGQVSLKPGESKKVDLKITAEKLKFQTPESTFLMKRGLTIMTLNSWQNQTNFRLWQDRTNSAEVQTRKFTLR